MWRVWMESQEYGAESFEYDTKREAVAGMNRLVRAAEKHKRADGIARRVSAPEKYNPETDDPETDDDASTMETIHIPPAYLSRFTRDGVLTWQVHYRGGPLCVETTEENARALWESWRNQGSQSVSAKNFPQHAPVYDGDAGRFLD